MEKGYISQSVINRLPRYYRFLGELLSKNKTRISSAELSRIMGVTASQIRQDLNCFGEFGQQGYGYNIELLHNEIANILGLNAKKRIILIGAGNLGRALTTNFDFGKRGFQLIGVFDKKESIIGQTVQNIPIHSIEYIDDFCRENFPEAAILCIPHEEAVKMVPILIGLGIRGFWNFSHYDIAIDHPDVAVENVHLSDSLMTLCYNIKHINY